jgi:hypothetical protein
MECRPNSSRLAVHNPRGSHAASANIHMAGVCVRLCRPDGSREAVAHPAGGSRTGTGTGCEELVGLDLHALACADLPEHAPQQPVAAA